MAYVEKYYTIWFDSEGKEHEIKLLQDGAAAGTTPLQIQDRVPYEYFYRGNKESQIESQVFGKEILFKFIIDSANIALIDAILESDYKEWKIEHYLESSLDGAFWLQPDNASRNYIKNGDYFNIKFSGVDGLANLKKVEFTNFTDGLQYEDRVTHITTIKRALEHVGHEFDFKVQVGTWCTNDSLMTFDKCALHVADMDSRRFQKYKDGRLVNTDCYTVISQLLEPYNAYLLQSEGAYWIIIPQEINSYYYPITWADLLVGTRTANDLRVTLVNGVDSFTTLGETERIRPVETVGLTFRDRNVRDNSLTNGDFHLPNTNEWVEGTGLESFTTAAYGPNYELAAAVVIPAGIPTEPPNFHSIAQAIVVRGEADQIQVVFKVRCGDLVMDAGWTGDTWEARFQVSCQVRKGTASGEILASGASPIILGKSDDDYREYAYFYNIDEDDDYFVELLIDKLESINWSDYDTIDVRFDDFDIIAAYSTGEDITFDSYYKVSNTDSNFTDFLEPDLQFGDSDSDTDIGAFKISGSRTETWDRYGKTENKSINFLAGINIIENFSAYKDYIRLEILDPTDKIKPHSIITIGSTNYQMVNQAVEYPVFLQRKLQVELVEILNDPVTVSLEKIGLSTQDGDGGSAAGGDGPVTDPGGGGTGGSPPPTPTLQQVTDVGNTTTHPLFIGQSLFLSGSPAAYVANQDPDADLIFQTHNGVSLVDRFTLAGDSEEFYFRDSNELSMFTFYRNMNGPVIRFFNSSGVTDVDLTSDITALGGQVGSIGIDLGATSGYEGYSIGGKVAFIYDNSTTVGLYDDVNNKWLLDATLGGALNIRFNGSAVFSSVNGGISVPGTINNIDRLQEVNITLTQSQIQNGATIPITFIPAISGRIQDLLSVVGTIKGIVGSGYSGGTTMYIRHLAFGAQARFQTSGFFVNHASTVDRTEVMKQNHATSGLGLVTAGVLLEITFDANSTGGSSGQTIYVTAVYRVARPA